MSPPSVYLHFFVVVVFAVFSHYISPLLSASAILSLLSAPELFFYESRMTLGAKNSQYFWPFIWPSRIPDSRTKPKPSFCWSSVVSCSIGCSAALPIVHFNCTPHKEQKYPVGTHIQSHAHIQAHIIAHPLVYTTNSGSTSDAQTLCLTLTEPPRHTPEEQYLNLLLFVLEAEQRYSSDWSKMCFLAGISNSNVSNELAEKWSEWKWFRYR